MLCQNCNREIPDTEKFCHFCGHRNDVNDQTSQNTRAQSDQAQAQNPQPNAPQPQTVINNYYGAQAVQTQDYVSIGGWCWLLLGLIPVVGQIIVFIMMLVYAFQDVKTYKYPCRVTFCRASLLFALIVAGLTLLFVVLFALLAASAGR